MNLRNWVEEREGHPEFEFDLLAIEVGEAIAGRLDNLGLSRSDLSRRMGVSRARVTQILAGDDNLTLKSLVAVANALGATLSVEFKDRPGIGATVSVHVTPESIPATHLRTAARKRAREPFREVSGA